jgi:hypothetical protein
MNMVKAFRSFLGLEKKGTSVIIQWLRQGMEYQIISNIIIMRDLTNPLAIKFPGRFTTNEVFIENEIL